MELGASCFAHGFETVRSKVDWVEALWGNVTCSGLRGLDFMNRDALLKVWDAEELPVCDEGMKLAEAFFVSAGEAVDRLEIECPAKRIASLTLTYTALVEHSAVCRKCADIDELYARETAFMEERERRF